MRLVRFDIFPRHEYLVEDAVGCNGAKKIAFSSWCVSTFRCTLNQMKLVKIGDIFNRTWTSSMLLDVPVQKKTFAFTS